MNFGLGRINKRKLFKIVCYHLKLLNLKILINLYFNKKFLCDKKKTEQLFYYCIIIIITLFLVIILNFSLLHY